MANSDSNKNNSNRAPQRGDIWRKHLDSEVVDLRRNNTKAEIKKEERNLPGNNQEVKPVRDIDSPKEESINIPEREYKNLLGQTIDEQYSISYLEAFNAREKKESKNNFLAFNDDVDSAPEELSKDMLSEQLSVWDKHDLAIQEALAERTVEIRTASVDSLMEEEEPAEVEEEMPKEEAVQRVSLIPRTAPHTQKSKDNKNTESKPKEEKPSRRSLRAQKKEALAGNKSTVSLFKETNTEKESTPSKNKRKKSKKIFIAIAVGALIFVGAAGAFFYAKAADLRVDTELRAQMAYQYMSEGKEALLGLDADKAQASFAQAQNEFQAIEDGFGFFGKDFLSLAAQFPIQSPVSSASRLVRAGKAFSATGYEASLALGFIQTIDPIDNENEADSYLTDNLIQASLHLQNAKKFLDKANTELAYVRSEDIPEEFQKDIYAVQAEANNIEILFEDAFSSIDLLLSFMGHSEPKKYLLAFQNHTELRATGGFIGSYGILTLNKGNMEDLFIDGIYNPDGQLKVSVVPPKPLQYVTPNWGTRDANWFYNFPTSAEKILWFFKHTGGPETDGVITMTPRVTEQLLELTGPIDMPKYGVVLDSNNFLELVQKEVEADYDKELNRPKQILADMAPILFERLSKTDKKIELFNIFYNALEVKDILVYSRDTEVQEFVSERNWAGEIIETGYSKNGINDYLSVVISNIGGWKTDKYTDTEVDTVTSINNEGEIIRTILISRRHNGGNTGYIWYDKPNYGYIRIYAPKGSEIISAEGFSEEPPYIKTNYEAEGYIIDPDLAEIQKTQWKHGSGTDAFEESGKTVFGNWLHVPAEDRKIAKITYKLPHKATEKTTNYSLTIQKQGGLEINYSGSIEELNDNLSFESCAFEGGNVFERNFRFMQEEDKIISCEL